MRGYYPGFFLFLLLGSCQRLGAPATPGAATQNRQDARPSSPDFTLPTTAGTLTLSSLRGSYVLLDFRTDGCAQCTAENANLRKLYGQFRSRGLAIVSVWLDARPPAQPAADSLGWLQVFDARGLAGGTAQAYEIKQVPATVLLDPRGHELARGLRGRDLGQKISEYIPLD